MGSKHWFTHHTDISPEELQRTVAWRIVVARAWSDDAFKAELLRDPRKVLLEYGIQAPAGIELKVVEDTANVKYLVLPQKDFEITVAETGSHIDPGF